MNLVYISSGIGIHIEAITDEFFSVLGNKFVFISTIKTGHGSGIHSHAEIGRDYSSKPYVINAWESEEKKIKAKEIIDKADVVIAGGVSFDFFADRVKAGKCTFLCNERWFKNRFRLVSLAGWKFLLGTLKRFQNSNFYYLALGAYCANDAKFLGIFKDRIYHFAYQVSLDKYDVKELLTSKRGQHIKIMWCARFIDWKHPELVVGLAQLLVANHYRNFEIVMVGGKTPMQEKIKCDIEDNNLNDYIKIISGIPNQQVRQLMKESHIFIITSDQKEGWGAVVNEAMNSGCAIVASNQVGSVPVLLKNNYNGLIYKSKSVESLYQKVVSLLFDENRRELLAYNAYLTITGEWSVQNAVHRFLLLSQSILDGKPIFFNSGPCSKAQPCNEKNVLK